VRVAVGANIVFLTEFPRGERAVELLRKPLKKTGHPVSLRARTLRKTSEQREKLNTFRSAGMADWGRPQRERSPGAGELILPPTESHLKHVQQ